MPRPSSADVLPDDAAAMRTASAVVADALRQSILRGTLPAGDRLRQDAIATRFGVSQTIVREAFRQLVGEGFLRAEPRRGVSVAAMTVQEAEEITTLRSLIEAQALQWAIPGMRDSDLDAAEQVLDKLDRARTIDDIIALNARFHEILYAPARRERTSTIITTLRFNFERYLRFTWQDKSHLARSQREHRDILKLCRARETEKACALLKTHILGTGAVLAERLQTLANAQR